LIDFALVIDDFRNKDFSILLCVKRVLKIEIESKFTKCEMFDYDCSEGIKELSQIHHNYVIVIDEVMSNTLMSLSLMTFWLKNVIILKKLVGVCMIVVRVVHPNANFSHQNVCHRPLGCILIYIRQNFFEGLFINLTLECLDPLEEWSVL